MPGGTHQFAFLKLPAEAGAGVWELVYKASSGPPPGPTESDSECKTQEAWTVNKNLQIILMPKFEITLLHWCLGTLASYQNHLGSLLN